MAELAESLETLLGRSVSARSSGPPRGSMPGAVTRYRQRSTQQGWLLVSELGLAVSLAAAFTSGPPCGPASRARAAKTQRSVRTVGALEDDLAQVFMVFSGVVPGAAGWEVERVDVVAHLAEDAVVGAAAPAWWTCGSLNIEGYPSGRIGSMAVR